LNVLFVLVDTLRAHRLSAYGYERETSPTFDYMSSTGVRFARHLAQSSWTKCSMASLWTGLYPQRTGVLRSEHAIPEEAILPAEILREAGYRTVGIWRNGWVSPSFGFDQGFEVYDRPVPRPLAPHFRVENPNVTLEGTDRDAVDSAVEFLRVYSRERWFLYLHLMDVHQYLYDSRTALFGPSYSDIYDNSIRHTDQIVGELLTHLVDEGLLDKTLVVLAADHGEAFGERGIEGHAREVFRETTEVPLVIGFPFQIQPGLVVDTISRNVDIWPTILDLLGLPPLPDTDGRSLVPQIRAAATRTSIPVEAGYAHLDRSWGRAKQASLPSVAVREGGLRYIMRREASGPPGEFLFDTELDPKERNNIVEERAEVAAHLRSLANTYLEGQPPWTAAPDVELDSAEAERLRALGYAVP
jgi:arylsulfatase A-like enzyme